MARFELVRRSDGAVVSSVDVAVTGGEVFDNVLQGSLQGDVVVPVGQNWLVGSPLTVRGNLRTNGGTISLRGNS